MRAKTTRIPEHVLIYVKHTRQPQVSAPLFPMFILPQAMEADTTVSYPPRRHYFQCLTQAFLASASTPNAVRSFALILTSCHIFSLRIRTIDAAPALRHVSFAETDFVPFISGFLLRSIPLFQSSSQATHPGSSIVYTWYVHCRTAHIDMNV